MYKKFTGNHFSSGDLIRFFLSISLLTYLSYISVISILREVVNWLCNTLSARVVLRIKILKLDRYKNQNNI